MAAVERARCPLCDAADAAVSPYRHGPFGVVRCHACRHWFLSPRLPEELMREAYASEDYFAGGESGYASYGDQERSLRVTFRRLLQTMTKRGVIGESLLDVGCGFGYLLDEARPFFQHRAGTDYSEHAVSLARTYSEAVYVGGAEAVPVDQKFDVITALHVVEHVYRPREFLSDLVARLNPGGWVLLAAPDMGSFWRHVMGKRWPSFKYPEHVSFFDRGTLQALLATAPELGAPMVVPYPHGFPLVEIAVKLGLPRLTKLARRYVWLPATTIALAARKA